MKTKAYLCILALAAVLACSCTRVIIDPASETAPVAAETLGQILVPFTAEAGSPDTRVAVSGSTANIVFSAGDQLMVYSPSLLDPSILTMKSGAGNRSATFTGYLTLKAGKTEADLAGKRLFCILIPAAGVTAGVFTYDDSAKKLTVDYSAKAVDSDLDALVNRTILYKGETTYEARKFEFEMLSSFIKVNVTVPSEESDLARDYTVEVSPNFMICNDATCSGSGWSTGNYAGKMNGTFTAASATSGTLYMAVLAAAELRIEDDTIYADEPTFDITMENTYKGYGLRGGSISGQVILPGKGYTKSITLTDYDNEDVLLGQPAAIKNLFMSSSIDKNGNQMLSKYEAAQVVSMVRLTSNPYLTDANFFRYFTGLASVEYQTFMGCAGLRNVSIPKNVTAIANQAFNGCSSLTYIYIPSKVQSIGSSAFSGCSSATSVAFETPSATESIGAMAFQGCSSLPTIVIPPSLKTIESNAFNGCTSLESVQFSSSSALTSIGKSAFEGCTSLEVFAFPSRIKEIAEKTFFGCTALESVTMGNAVKTVGIRAFSGCSSLRSISLPATVVTVIGTGAFTGCTSLTSFSLPIRIKSIEDDTFSGCTSLASVTIPINDTTIGKAAFLDCSALTTVSIPGSVTEIKDYAFQRCSNLSSVYCSAEIPPVLGINVFSSCHANLVIYVPSASLLAYRSALGWSTYRTKIQSM